MIKFVFILVFLSLSFVYTKNALHMFQQNRYETYRYTKWLFNKNNLHFSLAPLFPIVLLLVRIILKKGSIYELAVLIVTVLYSIYAINKESKKEYIKDLNVTARVKRQIAVMVILEAAIAYLLYKKFVVLSLVMIFGPYLLIYVMHLLTNPIENAVKKKYENEARNILDKMDDLIKVGITGSFGKTTTKNIVTDIISESYYTLMTPASYNTPMGITRTIREMLKPIHEVFVCEMGADHVGEITYLMNFVKPKYGIITSIGPQHLNTFKSMDNIIREKMEMIERLPYNGVGIINCDNEYINAYHIHNNCKVVKVGIENKEADYFAYDIEYTKDGSKFTLKLDDKEYRFETVLLGKHNIVNLLSAIALAKELKVPNEEIVKNVKEVKRVEHRLELKKINGYTFIDNAFNSNPVSSKLSLDVLQMMPGRRVIVTPGLIDLGDKQDGYNYQFGQYMPGKADLVILVGERTSRPIKEGLKEAGFNMDDCLVFASVKEAFAYIYTHLSQEDTILLENDLPDAFLY